MDSSGHHGLALHVLNALSPHIAVVNHTGEIIFVNKAWSDFANDSGGDQRCGLGANYIDVCRAGDIAGLVEATALLNGIRRIISGESEYFETEYPCHSPALEQWFVPGEGVVIIPLSAAQLTQRSSTNRLSCGNTEIDQMCGGGFFQDSIVLVSGATGTGKTLMSTTFMGAGPCNQEKSLLFAFEESRDQLFRNAQGWGVDYRKMEEGGLFRVICVYPESASLEDHLIQMKKEMDAFAPRRVAVDSLSALERISTVKGYREFVVGLTSFIKERQIAGMFTSTAATLLGGSTITETHISTITDSIILLRYVELYGEMRRGMTVLKMRGSVHDKQIREFTIDGSGIHVGRPFRGVTGILSGNFTYVQSSELDRVNSLFSEETSPV